ncbi:MAG: hypothetical protein JWL95_3037 [Gemmatimonadetes bacterium]|nr:hypothetical protein [Gemmatimonadota bacterium]
MVVGVVSALGVISVEAQMAALPNRPWFALALNPAVVIGVLVAAVLLWQRRRLGAYLLLAGAILPNLLNLAYGAPLRAPGLLMLLAIITVAANWRLLR